jgi:hypothetical protein
MDSTGWTRGDGDILSTVFRFLVFMILGTGYASESASSSAFVVVEGSPPLPRTDILEMDRIELSDSTIAGLRERILSWYLSEGYPFASAGFFLRAADTLVVRVVPGRHATLEEVRFEPEPLTQERILLRFLGMKPGDPYSQAEVEEWKSRLERQDFIDWTGKTRLALGNMGNLVLIQEIGETPMGYFAASMGYSGSRSGDRTEGGGEVAITNLLGTGRQLDLSIWSSDWGGVDASGRYREPWIFDSPVSLEIRASQELPESTVVNREAEVVAILDLESLETWVGAGIWKGFQPDSVDRTYSYGIAGAGILLGRRVPQGWQGFSASMESRLGRMSDADSGYVLASVDLEMRTDWFSGAFGLGAGLLAGGIVQGEWLDARLTSIGGIETLRGYAINSFRAGRYLVARPEVSLGETVTRAYLFSDIAVLHTQGGIRFPVGAGAGIRGRAGILELDAGVGFPLLEGLGRARFYLRALASII